MIQIVHPTLPARGRLFAGPRPEPPFAAALATLGEAGITTVACLLEPTEVPRPLEAAYARAPLQLLRFPVPDFDVPANTAAFRNFLLDLLRRLGDGESIYLHCRAGLGRTGTALACLLVLAGESARDAVTLVRTSYQPGAVETSRQQRFVESFHR